MIQIQKLCWKPRRQQVADQKGRRLGFVRAGQTLERRAGCWAGVGRGRGKAMGMQGKKQMHLNAVHMKKKKRRKKKKTSSTRFSQPTSLIARATWCTSLTRKNMAMAAMQHDGMFLLQRHQSASLLHVVVCMSCTSWRTLYCTVSCPDELRALPPKALLLDAPVCPNSPVPGLVGAPNAGNSPVPDPARSLSVDNPN